MEIGEKCSGAQNSSGQKANRALQIKGIHNPFQQLRDNPT